MFQKRWIWVMENDDEMNLRKMQSWMSMRLAGMVRLSYLCGCTIKLFVQVLDRLIASH